MNVSFFLAQKRELFSEVLTILYEYFKQHSLVACDRKPTHIR